MSLTHETTFPRPGPLPRIGTGSETINNDEVANAGWHAMRAGTIPEERPGDDADLGLQRIRCVEP